MANPFSAKVKKKSNPFAAKVKGTEKANPFAARMSTKADRAKELEALDARIEKAVADYEEALAKALKSVGVSQTKARFDIADRLQGTVIGYSRQRRNLLARSNGHIEAEAALWTERRKSGVKAKRSKNVQPPRHERPADKPAAKTGAKPFKSRTAAARKRKRG